jgi:methylenetetrahydrofolate reductase (NADPH)
LGRVAHLHIEVAAYPEFRPESASAKSDLDHFATKVRAGANSAITQYFFNVDGYCRFVEECEARGLDLPIGAGHHANHQLQTAGSIFGRVRGGDSALDFRKRLESYGEDLGSLRAFVVDVTTELCQKLLDVGAPGLHFYTLNRTEPTCTVWKRLGL